MTLRQLAKFGMILMDAAVFAGAFWLALATRYGTFFPPINVTWAIAAAPVAGVISLIAFGFYRELLRYIGPTLAYRAGMGVSLATLILLSVSFLSSTEESISRIAFVPFWMASILGVIGIRLVVRVALRSILGGNGDAQNRVLIYGAGEAGAGLLSMLGQDGTIRVDCFVDDNRQLTGRDVRGVRVHHPEEISSLIKHHQINTVMLALPSAGKSRRRKVIDLLSGFSVEVLTVPDLNELKSGLATVTDLRPIDIADLLGRDIVEPQRTLLKSCITGKNVLVTGAGGSIGTELCRQIIGLSPARLVLLDTCEFNLYKIDDELMKLNQYGAAVSANLGDVCDGLRLQELMQNYGIDTVYHAAAYKHVPIVEDNAVVGVRNNVMGTLRTAEAAVNAQVKNFVLISTDKAVRPTSVMGASKRLAEISLQSLAESSQNINTKFCMVRFGNVLGSSGSAVPKFIEQIQQGGPVTVTHEEITRFFMTVHEAANLVIQAGSLAKGGEVFVLDMGEPVKITDLATRMIELSGSSVRNEKNPTGEIEIKFTGLRPGEKLYEELLIDGDLEGTAHPKIMRSAEAFLDWDQLQPLSQRLEAALDRRDEASVVQILRETVSGYRGSTDTIVKTTAS